MAEEPRRLTPVVMFDDKERDQGEDVKDMRPLVQKYVEKHKGKSDHTGHLPAELDGHPDSEEGVPEGDDSPPVQASTSTGDDPGEGGDANGEKGHRTRSENSGTD